MNPKIEIKICIKIGNLKNQESKLIRDFDQEFSYKKFMLSYLVITFDNHTDMMYNMGMVVEKEGDF